MNVLPFIVLMLSSLSAVAEEGNKTIRLGKVKSDDRQLAVEHHIAESRIVGGSTASIDAYPFFVLWGGQCGASLIGREWLLSAAHCAGINTNSVRINQSRRSGSQGRGVLGTIARRIPHPEYNRNTIENDFLLMKLSDAVLDSGITPISLNMNTGIPVNNDPLKVIGFGRLSSGGSSPSTLQEVVVEYVPTDECNEEDSYDGDIFPESMLCAAVDGGGKDSCQGDSGGPLFIENSSGFTQVGVVSWGRGCARANYPGVYSRISGAMDWIKDTVCNDGGTQYKPDFCDGSGGGGSNPSSTRPPTSVPTTSQTRPPTSFPTQPPASQPISSGSDGLSGGNGSIKVRLVIKHDQYPDENRWEFRQNGVVVASGTGLYSAPYVERTYSYNMNEGDIEFRISDTQHDGICCSFGEGYYKIYVGDVEVVDSTGDFDAGETKLFTISDGGGGSGGNGSNPLRPPTQAPTRPPTQAPTQPPNNSDSGSSPSCVDTDLLFQVDNEVGEQDCTWLATNLDRYQYLCEFLDVAWKCKTTCDVCSYFE
eukprot:CAMPEP_0178898210 /NCGR_PEP_ID=MMETSP0786-20121207/2200_1 /TAXON_ID=186022 /ORGANISM="Thalassionema frauenfeldii, Strain CCMP 1798" /LENGTH=535 /DNA_ID=CAMNT_0020568895 /DNA_START=125 /DNA_END=1732 /DNA_ORIENTATION=+